jgi:transcriptional regulator with XRE-family HTH domain
MTQSDGERFRQMLGKKIKTLRTARGITQVELARALGFTSTGAISQVENGLRGLMFESIINAAKVLDVHPVFLMDPDDIESDNCELISAMLRLFEKRRQEPELADRVIEELRAVLLKDDSFTGGDDKNDAMT